MKKIILIIELFLISATNAYSYDNIYFHQKINVNGAIQSNNFNVTMKKLGFDSSGPDNLLELYIANRKIKTWFEDGGRLEDVPDCRSRNHFHDPIKSWDSAGLNDAVLNQLCGEPLAVVDSSVIWSQRTAENLYSWPNARKYYYAALISKDSDTREQKLASTFRSVGQVMHLLADSSVPEHVRNDIHIFPLDGDSSYVGPYLKSLGYTLGTPTYETWAKANYKNFSKVTGIKVSPLIFKEAISNSPVSIPITALWDQDKYQDSMPAEWVPYSGEIVGLAEYTNANFFSKDTTTTGVFEPYPHPSLLETNFFDIKLSDLEMIDAEDGVTDRKIYISKMIGEPVKHLAAISYLHSDLFNFNIYQTTDFRLFFLDDRCFEEYASHLVPMAVGYDTALLDYFFRGTMEITLPSSGIYSSTDDAARGFTKITLLAKNTTTTGDEMSNGTVELVAKYKLATSDPFQSSVVDKTDFAYKVIPEVSGIKSIPKDSPIQLTFDLGDAAIIPINATDVYLQVVYHGKLGQEEGAVTVGFKDISEPTPIDEYNNMDRICINGQWYVTGSPEAYDALPEDKKWWDIWAHDLVDEYIKISPVSQPNEASTTDYTFYKPLIEAGTLSRSYILSDYEFYYSGHGTMAMKDPSDNYIHDNVTKKAMLKGAGIKNQDEYTTDPAACSPLSAPCTIQYVPVFYPFRGVKIWGTGGFITEGVSYPNNTDPGYIPCSWNALNQ